MIDRAHLHLVDGGKTEAPREWSQRPGNVRLLEVVAEKYCTRCENAAGRAEYLELMIAWLLIMLVGSNGIWFVLWAVRKGILD